MSWPAVKEHARVPYAAQLAEAAAAAAGCSIEIDAS